MEKKNNSTAQKNGVFSTLGNWFRRTFRGGSKEMSDDEKWQRRLSFAGSWPWLHWLC